MTTQSTDINIGVTVRVTGFWASQALSDAGTPRFRPPEMLDKETQMKRIVRLAIALMLGVAIVSPILGASQASACHYTSQDRAKGYKC